MSNHSPSSKQVFYIVGGVLFVVFLVGFGLGTLL